MKINPYRIQPNQDWEIEEILNKEEELINNKTQLFLFLLKKYLVNYYHGCEKYYRLDGVLNFQFFQDTEELKFDKFYFPKANTLIKEKLRSVIEDLNEYYSVNDLTKTSVKNTDEFISITPFLYKKDDWIKLIKNICKKHYSKEITQFKNKTNLSITNTLKYLKIDKIWNLNNEYHYLISDEYYYKAQDNDGFFDVIESLNHDSDLIKSIESYKFQKENPHRKRVIYSLSDYLSKLNNLKIETRIKIEKTNFKIKLNKINLSFLYDKLEDDLSFFSIDTTKELWLDVMLNDFKETEKIKFTPQNITQVYYLFDFFLKEYSIFNTKEFYESNKFGFENIDLNYDSAKSSYNKAKKTYKTFKGKQVLDNIFNDIIKK